MTLTKEWLLKTISELEEERDAIPGAVNEDAAMALEAMKLALASMTAEPVAWQWEYRDKNHVTNDQARAKFVAQDGDVTVQPLFTAPPAPVVPDELLSAMEEVLRISDRDHDAWHKAKAGIVSCHAAMLQGADQQQNEQQNEQQNIPENIPTLREAVDVIRSSGIAIDAENIQAERDALNTPAIPDGYALVPIEPTQAMIDAHIEGVQSGGIQKGYRAMLAAAPQQEVRGE